MALEEELKEKVAQTFRTSWSSRDGRVVPEPTDLRLGNDAVKVDATVLYADMAGSTAMVDQFSSQFAAEVYKAYLECAARIVKAEGGTITAYDGDRIMAVYIGDAKDDRAAKSGLKINYAVLRIVNPALRAQYPSADFSLTHTVGIDASKLLVSRVGVRDDNDLTWVGRAANHAAKMTELEHGYVFISEDVFENLSDGAKYGGADNRLIWESRTWGTMGSRPVYRSNWWLKC